MKGAKPLALVLIALFVVSSVCISGVASPYTPPSSPPWIWLWASNYNVTTASDLTGTLFNVTVNLYNVTNLGAIQFMLWYNTSLLHAVCTYLSPMSQNYLSDYGPLNITTMAYTSTSPINNTLGRIYWYADVKVLTKPFNGTAPVLTIEFEIDTAPPLGYAPPNFVTYSCDLHFNETVLDWIKPVFPFPMGSYVLNKDYGLEDGLYLYSRPQITPPSPVASFTYSPATPRQGTTVTLQDNSSAGSGAHLVRWKWTVANDTGGAVLTGPNNVSQTTMYAVKAGYVWVTLNVTNNFNKWATTSQHIQILTPLPPTKLFVYPLESERSVGETFKIGVIINNVINLSSFEFKLSYNTTILDAINVWVMWPDSYTINETAGIIWVNASCPFPYPFSGNGTLAAITFTAIGGGYCVLGLNDTVLVNFYAKPIAHEAIDGYLTVVVHDVAVVNVAPSWTGAYPGRNIEVNATVKNEGTINETFWVAVYYNLTGTQWVIIGNQTVTNLAPGAERVVTFVWNTTSVPVIILVQNGVSEYGGYGLKATDSVVPSINQPVNNVLVYGVVKFRLLGDVNGDCVVNVLDMLALKIALSLGETFEENPFCDLNFDNKVNVMDMLVLKIILSG
jgi:hypothetical protein